MQICVTQLDGMLWCKITKTAISPWKPAGNSEKWNFSSDLSSIENVFKSNCLVLLGGDICCAQQEVDPRASGDYVKIGEVSASLLYGWH